MGKRSVWIAADSIVSPLGFTSEENYQNVTAGRSGISVLANFDYSKEPVHAAHIKAHLFPKKKSFTRFESICLLAVENALKKTTLDVTSDRVLFILSTTKGNIELLEQLAESSDRIHLPQTAKIIATHFGNKQQPLVISNACISGVMAVLVAKRIVQSNEYDHVVIIGADVLTRFVIAGFQSLLAISAEPCKPFDVNRKGVNLGEAAGVIILSTDPEAIGTPKTIEVLGGGLSNDANHISGPSRTGEELALAVRNAIADSGIEKSKIDFISAHGTATLFNDEMEAKAFNHAGLGDVPLNSLKGYFGHTLGAAGLVEIIISSHALLNNDLIPTFGFQSLGVSQPVNVIEELASKEMTTCLKTASGFGGCNAAVVLSKNKY
jgi:3-oxoacyl-[acyl-carrier-protein] synthase-1